MTTFPKTGAASMSNRFTSDAADPELVSFTASYLIEQMAPRLRGAGVTGREAAVAHLLAAGFGVASVNALVDRALDAAVERPAHG
jgi:hypothetical protein